MLYIALLHAGNDVVNAPEGLSRLPQTAALREGSLFVRAGEKVFIKIIEIIGEKIAGCQHHKIPHFCALFACCYCFIVSFLPFFVNKFLRSAGFASFVADGRM